ncbi:MAG: hypothetical protein KME07_12410 [Pegethrix bostrychoides GSE-TBD4-15B]|jgi:hypothetical protein|uniref:Uncharacterized protein n=1 Tax=Pegethrix bostrychoides GSE-TBD4-15B TaxID=2839662 RepID=A0A951PAV4_9CYAN|nr:hypothetical protein [Pegethrix bostrychoides GSE-TBD4-15B]
MSYREQLTPWIVVRLLPQMQHVILARFAKRSDADSYAQVLRQLAPVQVVVMFDPGEPAAQNTSVQIAKLRRNSSQL